MWTCEVCDQRFSPPDFFCYDGESHHVVATKEYLTNDAPSDPGHPAPGGQSSLRDGRLRICNIPPDRTVNYNGELRLVPGGFVEFIRGRFATDNPEVQYYLDKKGPAYFCTQAQWEAAWLSDGQRLFLDREKLAADRARLEIDQNALLAQVKELQAKQQGKER